MGKYGNVDVPFYGPLDANVMLIGEAPGEDEEDQLIPFVGKAGQFIARYLNRAGYDWDCVYRANLCQRRPHRNKFEELLGTTALTEGLEKLDAAIKEVNPNLIIAAGNWPMYYLTGRTNQKGEPGSGIMSWRGSVLAGIGDHVPSVEGRKVLVTYHPAFVIRPYNFGWHPVFLIDMKRVPLEAESPEINFPPYESHIDPPDLHYIAAQMSRSEWLTIDIETFGNSLACIGFADSTERGLCITFENIEGLKVAQKLLANDQRKIFQYGTFDINWLKRFCHWETNGYLGGRGFDTLIASANLLAEFPRGLDFLSSIYTPFPYYKTERKKWKRTGDMRTLWEYNIKDVICTHWIAMDQMKELEKLYGD